MDLHIIPGVKAKDVANAHLMDVMIQKEHSCTCMTYWIDEARGHVFCLIDAPSKEVVTELHDKAHGLVPHKIIEVKESLVQSFLGRVSDPEDAIVTDEGLKLINDPSYRVLLAIQSCDPVLLKHMHREKANEVLQSLREMIVSTIRTHGGIEAGHEGSAFISSFVSASKAVACAAALQQLSEADDMPGFKIAIHAGEPVTANEKLFGDTIRMAERICLISKEKQAYITPSAKQLLKDSLHANGIIAISPAEEIFLTSLFEALEENWQDSDFNMEDYCQEMAMSRSQLYRKTVALSGFSPNALLKEFRLEKAKELLKRKSMNIAQLSFDTGFSSPSYFTKCFKKKYGILPLAYLEILQTL